MLNFCASLIQTARVSGSALVLSSNSNQYALRVLLVVPNVHTNSYPRALFDECSGCLDASLALFQIVTQHRSTLHSLRSMQEPVAYRFQNILVDTTVAEWL